MTRHVVLLRAVNLGPNNRVPMPALREALTAAGYDDVVTYVASGNVVLSSGASAARVASGVHDIIEAEFGHDITVVVRSAADLRRVVDGNPWPEAADEPTKLVVAFLATKPAKDLPDADGDEPYRLRGQELYIWYRDGQGRSKLTNAFWEKSVGVPATARNWNTVLKLRDLSS